MVRSSTPRLGQLMAVAACVSLNLLSSAADAQQTQTTGSVEKVAEMLQSVDPYRPMAEVSGEIQVFGSTSMDMLAHGWVTGFNQFHPDAKVVISAAGSEKAFERLIKEPRGVAMLSRPVRDTELEELKSKGLKDPVAFVVAREALGVFVHADNPISTLSGEQCRNIFTGEPDEKLSWGGFGAGGAWSDEPVHIISRVPSSGTQKYLEDFVFKNSKLRPGVSEHESNAEVVKEIGSDPLAIGICGLKCGATTAKSLQLTIGSNVVSSDDHAILMGQYPFTRPLILVIDQGQEGPEATASREYVRYALCQSGQRESILSGFYPVDLPLLRASLHQLDGKATQ